MAATKTKTEQPEGTLKVPTSERYQVKYKLNGEVRYGTVRRIFKGDKSKEASKLTMFAIEGKLVVDDAILPLASAVKESDVTDVPMGRFDKDDEFNNYVEAAYQMANERSERLPDGVVVGKIFAVGVADGQAFYEITAVKGSKCDVEWRGYGGGDRYTDHYFGWGRKGVALKDVEAYVGRADGFKQLQREAEAKRKRAEAFLEVGSIVHVHDNHGDYTRCEVVLGDPNPIHAKRMGQKPLKGQKMLKPIALVGCWNKSDLPCYDFDGKWIEGYHVQKIRKGELMNINPESIYESPEFKKAGRIWSDGAPDWTTMPGVQPATIDPTKLEPLRIDPPMPTEDQLKQFAGWKMLKDIKNIVDPPHNPKAEEKLDYKNPVAMLAEANKRLEAVRKLLG